MFGKIIRSLDGIRLELDAVKKAIRLASEREREQLPYGDMPDRLSSLEGRLEMVLGQVEAGLVKAGSLKAAARAAEERAKGKLKRAEEYAETTARMEGGPDTDPFEQAGRQFQHELAAGNDAALEGVPPVSNGVEGRRAGLSDIRTAKRR